MMKKKIGAVLVLLAIAVSSFAFASDDKVDVKVFFIYPNGDIKEQDCNSTCGSVDFTEDPLAICNDLLYIVEDVLPDTLNARQENMLDIAQRHIDKYNLTDDITEIKQANIILRHIVEEIMS